MTCFLRLSLSTIFAVVLSLPAPASLAQSYRVGSPDSYALAVELRSGDTERIEEALEQFPDYYDVLDNLEILADMDSFVQDGLISALDSQLDYYESEVTGDMEEYFYEAVIEPLVLYTSRIENRSVIPVLLRASETNNVASLALARFGPDMVPVILDYMQDPERTVRQIHSAFEPLRFIVSLWRPLDTETHAILRELAIDCMQERTSVCLYEDDPSYHVKYHGSGLASALGDADLKQMVIDIADEIPGFFEINIERWYEGPSGAAPENQIAPND